LAAENDQLRSLLTAAGIELDKNYTQMVLMEPENGNLRQQVFLKKNQPKRTYTTGKARLMTSAEMQKALLEDLQKKQMTELHGGSWWSARRWGSRASRERSRESAGQQR
jgi:hypothetical protein